MKEKSEYTIYDSAADLHQIYSHLGVEAFGDKAQDEALKVICGLKAVKEFSIFDEYIADYKTQYSFINEEGDFSTEHWREKTTMNCCQLFRFIFNLCDDRNFCSINFCGNLISIRHFNDSDGTCAYFDIKIEPSSKSNFN